MTENHDWFTFLEKYCRRFLGPDENHDFIEEWKPEILKRDLADMLAAIGDVALSSELVGKVPFHEFRSQQLRLLLEHADARADSRRPFFRDPFAAEPVPQRGSRWNRHMLAHGIITKKEFEKRERDRA